ncbi:MAG: hypothetical protein ACI4Q6_08945 [Huintestinicola sp.]
MKKIFLVFMLAASLICFGGCNKQDTSPSAGESAPVQGIGELNGVNYTILVDMSKWADVYGYIDKVSGYAESVSPDAGISKGQYESMCDGMFISYEHTNANFNITTVAIGTDIAIDADYYVPILKEQYAAVEGYEFKSYDTVDINGYKALRTDVDSSVGGENVRMTQFIFWQGGYQVAVTYSADLEAYDAAWQDFEEAIGTISFAVE